MIAWQHAFGDLDPATSVYFSTTGAGFSVTGAPLASDAALVALGLDLRITDRARLGIAYQGTLSGSLQDNAATGHFSWNF
jgi:outer membrane autotransporter protein